MAEYHVWVPDDGENESHARVVKGYDAEDVARTEVERRYSDDPFGSAMTDHVRCPDGALCAYEVHPEPSIVFYSYEVDVTDE